MYVLLYLRTQGVVNTLEYANNQSRRIILQNPKIFQEAIKGIGLQVQLLIFDSARDLSPKLFRYFRSGDIRPDNILDGITNFSSRWVQFQKALSYLWKLCIWQCSEACFHALPFSHFCGARSWQAKPGAYGLQFSVGVFA